MESGKLFIGIVFLPGFFLKKREQKALQIVYWMGIIPAHVVWRVMGPHRGGECMQCLFPAIDPVATGRNIVHLRKERGLSVRDLQSFFHFDEPRAIYKWQTGQSLPSIDNLYALSALLGVPMDRILVGNAGEQNSREPQADACGSGFLFGMLSLTGPDGAGFCGYSGSACAGPWLQSGGCVPGSPEIPGRLPPASRSFRPRSRSGGGAPAAPGG